MLTDREDPLGEVVVAVVEAKTRDAAVVQEVMHLKVDQEKIDQNIKVKIDF
jgi:hypothetical protein